MPLCPPLSPSSAPPFHPPLTPLLPPLCPPLAALLSLQYFWEAFPTGTGPTDRTTYMFTYADAEAYRPSLEQVS